MVQQCRKTVHHSGANGSVVTLTSAAKQPLRAITGLQPVRPGRQHPWQAMPLGEESGKERPGVLWPLAHQDSHPHHHPLSGQSHCCCCCWCWPHWWRRHQTASASWRPSVHWQPPPSLQQPPSPWPLPWPSGQHPPSSVPLACPKCPPAHGPVASAQWICRQRFTLSGNAMGGREYPKTNGRSGIRDGRGKSIAVAFMQRVNCGRGVKGGGVWCCIPTTSG